MIIYVDNDCKCHLVNDGTMVEVETDFFDGKCNSFIEGYRLVPENRTWTREDGKVFSSGMIAPWQNSNLLTAYQYQYETMQAELDKAYQNGVNSI
jgi:hypothetical protein